MSNESTMNVRGQRRSNRPSVAAKMSQLANDSGDISYDSVLRIVGDEIDAEKKSKMLLRTSLMLLFSLLALTAANAGLTFAVVEFAKETSVSGDVLTVKGTEQAVKTSSADFQLVDGRMMTAGAAPAPIATVGDVLSGIPSEDLMFAAAMDLSVLGQVDSLDIESESGAVRSFVITGHTLDEEMSGVTFHTAAGVDVTINGDGDIEVDDAENSRSLLKDKEKSKPLSKNGRKIYFQWKRRMQQSHWKRRVLSLNTRFGGGFSAGGDDEAIAKNVVVKAAQLPAPAAKNARNVGAIHFDFTKSSLKFDAGKGTWSGGGSGGKRHLSAAADAYVYEPFSQMHGFGSGSGSRFLYQYAARPPPPPAWTNNKPLSPAYICAVQNYKPVPEDGGHGYYCENVDSFSYMSYDDLGVTMNPAGKNWLCDMWGYQNGNRKFVLQSTTNSVSFVEVTDPNNPYVVGTHMLDGYDYQWYWSAFPKYNIISDVKVLGDTGYFVSWRYKSSIAKMDLTQLVDGHVGADFVHGTHLTAYRPCCHYNFFGRWVKYLGAHNIVAFSNLILGLWVSPTYVGFNYACTAGDGGVMILDAHDPANQVGCISESGSSGFGGNGKGQFVGAPHDAACHDFTRWQMCYLAGGYSGKISGVDVTPLVNNQSANLRVVHQITLASFKNDWECAWSSSGFCKDMVHQIAIHPDAKYMVITDEFDEVNAKIADKPMNMRLRTYKLNKGNGAFKSANVIDTGRAETRDHQGYIYDEYYFLAAVRAGVIFYKAKENGKSLEEIGIFDTHPDVTSLNQFGAWTVFAFPYTVCGNTYYLTAIADMAGLHMVQPVMGNKACGTRKQVHKNFRA